MGSPPTGDLRRCGAQLTKRAPDDGDSESFTLKRAPQAGLGKLPRSPFWHAALTTPADRTGAIVDFFPVRAAFPGLTGGSASATSLSRPAQASLTLQPTRLLP